jgi:hypothetical protein
LASRADGVCRALQQPPTTPHARPGRSRPATFPAENERHERCPTARPPRRTARRISAGRVTCAAFPAPTGLTSKITSPSTAADCRCRSCSPPARPATSRNCCRCLTRLRSVGTDPADRANARTGCSPTGLLSPLDPDCAAAPRYQVHQPAAPRPDRSPPAAQGLPRRPATRLRGRALRRPQRRRALRQPAEAVPRPAHPLRGTSRLLPRRNYPRRDRDMAAHGLAGHARVAGGHAKWTFSLLDGSAARRGACWVGPSPRGLPPNRT